MHIILYGLSGCGKSTLSEGLSQSREFMACKMSVTREKRADDTPELYEYLSIPEYLELRKKGSFALDADDGKRYYGYQWKHLKRDESQISILLGTPQTAFTTIPFLHINVLIEGEANKGLQKRGNLAIAYEREAVNRNLQNRYYGQETFRRRMHLILHNPFYEGKDASVKISAWIRNQGWLMMVWAQQGLARHGEPRSAAWLAAFYSRFHQHHTDILARRWGQKALFLGWLRPLMGNRVCIMSNLEIACTVLTQKNSSNPKKLIQFLFRAMGVNPTHFKNHKEAQTEWNRKIPLLFHG